MKMAFGLTMAALLAASPAFATSAQQESSANFTADLARVATEQHVREALAQRGYIVTSEFRRGSDGELMAQALKNGVPVSIVHKMPPRLKPNVLTN